MSNQQEKVKFKDVKCLLEKGFIYLTGGHDKNRHPIITFPDAGATKETFTESDCRLLLHYLITVPIPEDLERGFVVVLDRRKDSWNGVKLITTLISCYFPACLHTLFLLRPQGILQKVFGDTSLSLVRSDVKYEVLLCDSPAELHTHIAPDQLTADLEGSLVFDKFQWIAHRASVDQFMCRAEDIEHDVTHLSSALLSMDLPLGDEITLASVRQGQSQRREELIEDVIALEETGGNLIGDIEFSSSGPQIYGQSSCSLVSPVKFLHVASVRLVLSRLKRSRDQFDLFWMTHQMRLDKAAKVANFVTRYDQMLFLLTGYESTLLSGAACLGSSHQLEHVTSSVREAAGCLEEVLPQCHHLIQEARTLTHTYVSEEASDGEEAYQNGTLDSGYDEEGNISAPLDAPDDALSLDRKSVQLLHLDTKAEALSQIMDRCSSQFRPVLDKLERLQLLYDLLEKGQCWVARGMELVTLHARDPVTQDMDQSEAREALEEVEAFLTTKQVIAAIDHPKRFRRTFSDLLTLELNLEVQRVLRDIENVTDLCQSRCDSLRKVVDPSGTSCASSEASSGHMSTSFYLPSNHVSPPSSNHGSTLPSNHTTGGSEVILRRDRSVDSEKRPQSLCNVSDRSSQSSMDQIEMDTSSMQRQRDFVIQELIQTERDYVDTLSNIHKIFWNILDNPENQESIPEEIREDRSVLFGNWEDILDFHKSVILPQMEDCLGSPCDVGLCFSDHRDRFIELYSLYCVQHSSAQSLLSTLGGEDHPLLRLSKGSRPLSLASYLLQPVQRVQKYHLLLHNMINACSDQDPGRSALDEGLSTMLNILRYVNDAMNQLDIRGYKGKLSRLGRLYLHDEFQVWLETKESRIKLRPKQRRLFLYDKAVLLCKRRDALGRPESVVGSLLGGSSTSYVAGSSKAIYDFKVEIPTEKIGLTQSVGRDKRRFAIWTDNRSLTYVLQAAGPAVKETWVGEIKALLVRQFEDLREQMKQRHKPPALVDLVPPLTPEVDRYESDSGSLYSTTDSITSTSAVCGPSQDTPCTTPLHQPILDSLPVSSNKNSSPIIASSNQNPSLILDLDNT